MIKIQVTDKFSYVDAPPDVIRYLRIHMRVENDIYARRANKYLRKYKYLVTKKGRFRTGALPRVVKIIKKLNREFELDDRRLVTRSPDMDRVKVLLKGMRIGGNPLKLRSYQIDSLITGLKKTRGIFDLCTGAGKTVIMAALMNSWWKKTLVVINSKDLARQLQSELADYMQQPVGFIGAGVWNPKQFTVAIDATLTQGKDHIRDYLKDVEYLVFDEVHHLQAKTWQTICDWCSKASIVHGFSGTPQTSTIKLEDGSEGDMNAVLYSYIGPVIARVKASELIRLGYLAKPYVNIVKNQVYFDSDPLQYNREYNRIIVEDDIRNNIISKITHGAYEQGEQVIGFVRRIEHGNILEDMMAGDYGIPSSEIGFCHGSTYDREGMIKSFKQGDLRVLFGTVLTEGLNFHCDVGINMAGGKSYVKAIQKIGRILRKTKGPNGEVDTELEETVKYYDFADRGHVWYSEHADVRINTYRDEGHDVEFINPDQILKGAA